MAKAIIDSNGFIEIKDNKLSKPGVFDYLGSEIGAPEPNKIYHVLRPKEELQDQACIDSFKLQPWIIRHKMLGKEYNSRAEDKGIHGVIGESVYYDKADNWLKGNIKIFSETLETEIENGVDELSLGFKCVYEFGKTGTYQGKHYNVVQRKIRGNHLASVEESRMDVAVMDCAMDSMTVKINSTGANKMAKKSQDKEKNTVIKGTGEDGTVTLEDIASALSPIISTVETMQESMATMDSKITAMDKGDYNDKNMDKGNYKDKKMDKGKDNIKEGYDKDDDDKDKDKKDKDMYKEKKGGGMDQAELIKQAVSEAVKPLTDEIATLTKKQDGMDSGVLLREIGKRDDLAAQLSYHVGTFDHASKTLAQVAAYGADKLGVPCEKGTEVAAMTAYLHNRPRLNNQALYATKTNATGEDGKTAADPVDGYLEGEK
jgi:hypothetical protein